MKGYLAPLRLAAEFRLNTNDGFWLLGVRRFQFVMLEGNITVTLSRIPTQRDGDSYSTSQAFVPGAFFMTDKSFTKRSFTGDYRVASYPPIIDRPLRWLCGMMTIYGRCHCIYGRRWA
jgi:hypothetical protein